MEEQKNSSKYRPQVRHVGGKRRRRDDFGPSSPSRSSTEPLLPADVLDLILDRLPVWERCRMRCVCKAWNNPSKLKSGEEELWFLMVRPPGMALITGAGGHAPPSTVILTGALGPTAAMPERISWLGAAYSSLPFPMLTIPSSLPYWVAAIARTYPAGSISLRRSPSF
ncbi:hypothetical protein L7F22_015183 [Adiantum nelumboides]|nr:hypothetical protein [Adiantum nelumboides]